MPKQKLKKKAPVKPTEKNQSPVLSEIKGLYSFMKDNSLETLDYQKNDTRIKLVRKSSAKIPVPVYTTAAAMPAAAGNSAAVAEQETVQLSGKIIKAPVSGIFFRASSPSSPPFVREGDVIEKGQVICLIEAMKVYNEVTSEFAGEVSKVLRENGAPVKKGDDLFVIK